MKNKLSILLLVLTAALYTACAQSEGEDWDNAEDESLELWMARNHPQAQKQENGMYIEWLRESVPGAQKPDAGDWLQLNYRGTTLGGDVFKTRYEDEAKILGSFSRYCHYVPHYMLYSESMNLTEGEIAALGMIGLDDSVRIYLPSQLAYGGSGANFSSFYGYEGSLTTLRGNRPVIIDLVLKEIIADEEAYERNKVQSVAREWGLGINDTIRPNLYLEVLRENKDAAIIAEDSVVYIEYIGRFLDEFLLDTNVDTVAQKERLDYGVKNPVKLTVASSTNYIKAWTETFISGKLRYDSHYRIVFISDWGYGSTEQAASATSPVIYPYTPLMFELRTLEEDYGTEEENSN